MPGSGYNRGLTGIESVYLSRIIVPFVGVKANGRRLDTWFMLLWAQSVRLRLQGEVEYEGLVSSSCRLREEFKVQ